MSEDSNTIKNVSKRLGLSEVYVRRMIQQGKLETVKVQVSENVWRHEIPETVLQEWRNKSSAHTTRTDGRNKYTVYATTDEIEAFKAWLAESGNQMKVMKANPTEVTKKRYQNNKLKRLAKKQKTQ